MSGHDIGHARLHGSHWAAAYGGYIAGLILTVAAYLTGGFGLYVFGLGLGGLVVVAAAVPLVALAVLRGGYRLAALGLFLAAPVTWFSFGVFLLIGGVVAS